MSRTYIFDVDGTLMDINHRRKYVEGEKKDWNKFFEYMEFDTPRPEIFDMAHRCSVSVADTLFIVSGRNEKHRDVTEKQLDGIRYKTLIMRPDDNYEPDHVFKKSILDMLIDSGYTPDLVFDDRPTVIDMWRKNGIPCCDVGGWSD